MFIILFSEQELHKKIFVEILIYYVIFVATFDSRNKMKSIRTVDYLRIILLIFNGFQRTF